MSSIPSAGNINTNAQVINGNFKYIGKAYGEATIDRYLMFFSNDSFDLYNRAMANLTNETDLYIENRKRALINITYDHYTEGFFIFSLFYSKEVLRVSADLIEFVDEN